LLELAGENRAAIEVSRYANAAIRANRTDARLGWMERSLELSGA